VNISRFQGQSGVDEYHLIVCPTAYGSFDTQLEWVSRAYRQALDSVGLDMQTAVLRRFFCSDLFNQTAALEARPFSNPCHADNPCAVSWAGQPPIPPAKVALWAYHVCDPNRELDKIQEGATLTLNRGDISHHWTTGINCVTGNTSYDQTRGIFKEYDAFLRARGLSLTDNVIRTWLFVQDIDANYQGLVVARREFFAECGLTPDTHFIASSGIEGRHAEFAAKVSMDAYAISGIRLEQIEFLAALDHLSPTHFYGVTFERGTSVAYRDRKHVIISGTASIDHRGNILYPGDVSRQLDRTIENMEALLKQAGAALEDMCVFIVYVRDPSDYAIARQQMRERFGDAPLQVVVAPVCRPGWLIEVEGNAIVASSNPGLPDF
jgi:enamine deaminase RidA (YjgF/YER057c/UK114 family)